MSATLDEYHLSDIAPVLNLIIEGSQEGHFNKAYGTLPYIAGLGKQLFTLLIGRIKLNGKWHRASVRILRVKGEFAGFIMLVHELLEAEGTEIYMCAIKTEHRGKGLGAWMLRSVLADMPDGHKIFAACLPASQSMRVLLSKLGFKKRAIPLRGCDSYSKTLPLK